MARNGHKWTFNSLAEELTKNAAVDRPLKSIIKRLVTFIRINDF